MCGVVKEKNHKYWWRNKIVITGKSKNSWVRARSKVLEGNKININRKYPENRRRSEIKDL